MKKRNFLICIFSLFIFASCARQETEINGEVFIVTAGAGSYKMGLVEVLAIPEDKIKLLMDELAKSDEERTAHQEYLRAKEQARQDYAKYEKALSKYESQKSSVELASASGDLVQLNQAVKTLDEMKWTESEIEALKSKYDASVNKAAAAFEKLTNASSAERYFASLPAAAAKATTNADGKFVIKLPSGEAAGQRFALAARGARKVGDETEKYYWLVWVESDGTVKNILLSNNNHTDSGAPDSLIKTNKYQL